MTTEKDYVERLEKIIDKQDNLLSQLDARFNQQNALNEYLFKQNNYLEEDIRKHKDLTRDLNKTVEQQENNVAKLKKELEDQLKIQQDLHKEYDKAIKQLTADLEDEQNKNKELNRKQADLKAEIEKLKKAKATQTAKSESKTAGATYYGTLNTKATEEKKSYNKKTCPKCGAIAEKGHLFCESCGTKL